MASASATAVEALEDLLRYFRLTQTSMNLTINKGPREIELAASAPREFSDIGAQVFEWGTAVLISTLRYLTKETVNPSLVSFTHYRSVGVTEFADFFRCDVRFGQGRDFMTIPDPLDTEIRSADPYLATVLSTICDDAVSKQRDVAVFDLRGRAEGIIVELLPHRTATSENVAKELALSTRTFARVSPKKARIFLTCWTNSGAL